MGLTLKRATDFFLFSYNVTVHPKTLEDPIEPLRASKKTQAGFLGIFKFYADAEKNGSI